MRVYSSRWGSLTHETGDDSRSRKRIRYEVGVAGGIMEHKVGGKGELLYSDGVG